MTPTEMIQIWIEDNPYLAFGSAVLLSIVVFFIVRLVLGRGLTYLASRTETKYDDIFVKGLHPFRVAYAAPLIVLYIFAYVLPEYEDVIKEVTLFLILWVLVFTLNSLLDAFNKIYESSPSFTGVSIMGYLDIVKIIFILVGVILSISMFTGESPIVLLSGLGAITAILLLVFQNTILSLVASIQISTNDLIKEGDWIEVPSYDADGEIIDMGLHVVKIQNWDKTLSVIPTYKFTDVAFKNWRSMQESGGRRIKRAINIDLHSIKFCTDEMLDRWEKIELIRPYLEQKQAEIAALNKERGMESNTLANSHHLTNIDTFQAYIEAYLKTNKNIHQKGMTSLIYQLAPSPKGLPIEVYVFTKTTDWEAYEKIQGEIFNHLLAIAPEFDLVVFQEATQVSTLGLVSALREEKK
jgi:miniconductance mechanosensitive channel